MVFQQVIIIVILLWISGRFSADLNMLQRLVTILLMLVKLLDAPPSDMSISVVFRARLDFLY